MVIFSLLVSLVVATLDWLLFPILHRTGRLDRYRCETKTWSVQSHLLLASMASVIMNQSYSIAFEYRIRTVVYPSTPIDIPLPHLLLNSKLDVSFVCF